MDSLVNSKTACSCFFNRSQRLCASDLAILPRLPLARAGMGGSSLPPRVQDVAIAFAQVSVFLLGQLLGVTRRHFGAGFLEQPFHVPGPGVLIGVDDELQFPQEMRAA